MDGIKILVAEDDDNIRMGICDILESENYTVCQTGDGKQALEMFEKDTFDLLLLDVMMPEINGYDLCREVRAKDQRVPVIMLTAKSEEIDKVVGLKLGADDYMTKPFGIHELLARISAVLRRSGIRDSVKKEPESVQFTFAGFTVDTGTFKLSGEKGSIDLSKRELSLLLLFNDHQGQVLSRDTILNAVWGIEYLGTTRTLDQHIAQLRKKIEKNPANPVWIKTVHGVGYRYETLEDSVL